MSRDPIFKLVDNLPTVNMTVFMLQALDFVVPGEWTNEVGFDAMIRAVTGETDEKIIQQTGERAVHLYNDRSEGYQRAIWLYQTIDVVDAAMAASAIANKVGNKVNFLSFLSKISPKPDHTQLIDLSLKLVAEVVAFCLVNGLPGDSIEDFARSLADYSGEEKMRMAALICVDGIIPLGPDFVDKALATLDNLQTADLENNEAFQRIRTLIPGDNTADQQTFLQKSMTSVQGWMKSFVDERNLDRQKVVSHLKDSMEIADDKLDYLAAFLDMSTNYYEHTGIQTVARRLIQRAVSEI